MKELKALVAVVKTLPKEHQIALAPALLAVTQRQSRRTGVLNLIQESLGQLRLDMKYLMFDLESTRQERDALRTKLEK
jgi:hypothetical protein